MKAVWRTQTYTHFVHDQRLLLHSAIQSQVYRKKHQSPTKSYEYCQQTLLLLICPSCLAGVDAIAITVPAGTGETAAGPATIYSVSSISDGATCIDSVFSVGRTVPCVTRSGRLVVRSREPWWFNYITRTPARFGISEYPSETNVRCLKAVPLSNSTKRNTTWELPMRCRGC